MGEKAHWLAPKVHYVQGYTLAYTYMRKGTLASTKNKYLMRKSTLASTKNKYIMRKGTLAYTYAQGHSLASTENKYIMGKGTRASTQKRTYFKNHAQQYVSKKYIAYTLLIHTTHTIRHIFT